MKRIILFLIGFFPLPLGYLVNHLMMTVFYNYVPPSVLYGIGIAVLAVWFLIGFFSNKFFSSKFEAVILLNSAAFIILLLILVQEIILHAYWFNHIGIATQFFYLPLLSLAGSLTRMLPRIFYADIVAFGFLLIASYLGHVVGARRINHA